MGASIAPSRSWRKVELMDGQFVVLAVTVSATSYAYITSFWED